MVIRDKSFVPFDEAAEDDMRDLGSGPFMVSVKVARSIPFDRLYRGCLASICKSGGYDKGPDAFHELTKTLASFLEVDVTPVGQVVTRSKSINHRATDRAGFRQFFDNAINAWVESGYYEYLAPDLRKKLEAGER